MANTFIPIAKTVLTGTQATITFSSIPQTYTDLKLHISSRGNTTPEYNIIQFGINGGYPTMTYTRILQNGSSAVGSRASGEYAVFTNGTNSTSEYFGPLEFYIPRYTNTSYNKIFASMSYQGMTTTTANTHNLSFGQTLFQSTSAISSIEIVILGGSFVAGSRFDLYGIKNS